MSGIHESLDRDGHARLARWLARAGSEKLTGTLRVAGLPGGVIQLRDGAAIAVRSPGAPGVQALLVRTGRVEDEVWVKQGGHVERAASTAHIGSAHLQVIQMMASHDALFAIVAGRIENCTLHPDLPVPGNSRGEDPEDMLGAALRRLDALAGLPRAIMPYRDRLAGVPGTGDVRDHAEHAPESDGLPGVTYGTVPGSTFSEVRRHVLRYADGRRTARDIAFLAGRSLYAVTVEMSRMLSDGLLSEASRGAEAAEWLDVPGTPLLPRRQPDPAPESPEGPSERLSLPHRSPGASRVNPERAGRKALGSWKDFLPFGGRMGESRG